MTLSGILLPPPWNTFFSTCSNRTYPPAALFIPWQNQSLHHQHLGVVDDKDKAGKDGA